MVDQKWTGDALSMSYTDLTAFWQISQCICTHSLGIWVTILQEGNDCRNKLCNIKPNCDKKHWKNNKNYVSYFQMHKSSGLLMSRTIASHTSQGLWNWRNVPGHKGQWQNTLVRDHHHGPLHLENHGYNHTPSSHIAGFICNIEPGYGVSANKLWLWSIQ